MARYAAFLRAINVSNRRATGAQLRAAAEREGFEEVASFRNSATSSSSAAAEPPRWPSGWSATAERNQGSGLNQAALAMILGQSTTRTMGMVGQIAAKYS